VFATNSIAHRVLEKLIASRLVKKCLKMLYYKITFMWDVTP
jgi:hypothetical protein